MQALEGDAARALLADDADQVHEGGAALRARDEPVGLQHVAGDAVDGLEALEVALGARPDETANEEAAPRSARTTCLPTKPVPPVTNTRCMTNES